MDLIPKVIPVELFLGMVHSSSTDAVITRVTWMFMWMMKMRLKPLELSTCVKFTSKGWLLMDPFKISEIGNDLKIT